jgi:hypothetical protein
VNDTNQAWRLLQATLEARFPHRLADIAKLLEDLRNAPARPSRLEETATPQL